MADDYASNLLATVRAEFQRIDPEAEWPDGLLMGLETWEALDVHLTNGGTPPNQWVQRPAISSTDVERGDYWFSVLTSDDLYLIRDALSLYEKALTEVGSGIEADYRPQLRRVIDLRVQMQKAAAQRIERTTAQ